MFGFRRYDRSFTLGVVNGVLFNLAEAVLGGTTVLPIFISNLTASKVLIGLAGTLGDAGWFMPQLAVANIIEHRERKMPLYLWSGIVRMAAIWAIAIAVAVAGHKAGHAGSGLLLAGFFILYSTYSLAGGVAGIPFMDIVAKTVPADRRGTFFGLRIGIGGAAAALGGIFVSGILRTRPFPQSFTILFFATAAVVTVALVSFIMVKEPAGSYRETRMPFWQFLHRGPALFKKVKSYRRLFIVRVLLAVWGMALPFYIILAREKHALPPGSVGIFLSIQVVGSIVSNLLWGYLSNHVGNKKVLELVSAIAVACPIVALVGVAGIPSASTAVTASSGATAGGAPIVLFGVVFFLIGVSLAGINLGFNSYILDVCPADERPAYLGFMSTFLSPAMLLSALGGLVIEKTSYAALFGIALAAAAGAFYFAHRLEELRVKSAATPAVQTKK
jgi:MFS family permease